MALGLAHTMKELYHWARPQTPSFYSTNGLRIAPWKACSISPYNTEGSGWVGREALGYSDSAAENFIFSIPNASRGVRHSFCASSFYICIQLFQRISKLIVCAVGWYEWVCVLVWAEPASWSSLRVQLQSAGCMLRTREVSTESQGRVVWPWKGSQAGGFSYSGVGQFVFLVRFSNCCQGSPYFKICFTCLSIQLLTSSQAWLHTYWGYCLTNSGPPGSYKLKLSRYLCRSK